MIRTILSNTGANFAFRAFSMVLAFVSVPILVGSLGAAGYGILLLADSLMGYFSVLNAGVPAGTVKFVAEYEAKGEHDTVFAVIGSSLTFFLGAGLLVAGAVAAFTAFGGVELFRLDSDLVRSAESVLYLAAALAVFSWPSGTFGQTLDGLQRYGENRIAVGLGNTVGRLLSIAAAIAGAPIEGVFIASQAGIPLTAALQYRAVAKALPGWALRRLRYDRDTFQTMFGYSVWMLVQKISALLLYHTDRIILSLFLSVESITIYHVVTRPFNYIKEFSMLSTQALMPAVSAAEARRGRSGLDGFIYLAGRYSNAFLAPLAVIGTYLSGPLIGLWMGPDYLPYAWIAQSACLFQLIWQANAMLGRVFSGTGVVKRITLIGLFGALINVPLGIWWVQTIGVAGVVFSTMAAAGISIPLQYAFAMPELRIDRSRYLLNGVVRGQMPAWLLGLVLLPFWTRIQSIASWATFAVVGLVMGVVFYSVIWKTVVESRHRIVFLSFVPASLRPGSA